MVRLPTPDGYASGWPVDWPVFPLPDDVDEVSAQMPTRCIDCARSVLVSVLRAEPTLPTTRCIPCAAALAPQEHWLYGLAQRMRERGWT